MSTHGLQTQTTEWWVAKLAGAVQEAADEASKHGSETVRLLDRTRVKCEYVDQARQSARLTSEAATDASAAMIGLDWFLGQAVRRMASHRRLLTGLGVSACGVALGLFVFPAGVDAKPEVDPERQAVELIERGEYDEAVIHLTRKMDCPRGWHLRGELEAKRGDGFQAGEWHRKAALAGDELAALSLDRDTRREPVFPEDDAVPLGGGAAAGAGVGHLDPPGARPDVHPLATAVSPNVRSGD